MSEPTITRLRASALSACLEIIHRATEVAGRLDADSFGLENAHNDIAEIHDDTLRLGKSTAALFLLLREQERASDTRLGIKPPHEAAVTPRKDREITDRIMDDASNGAAPPGGSPGTEALVVGGKPREQVVEEGVRPAPAPPKSSCEERAASRSASPVPDCCIFHHNGGSLKARCSSARYAQASTDAIKESAARIMDAAPKTGLLHNGMPGFFKALEKATGMPEADPGLNLCPYCGKHLGEWKPDRNPTTGNPTPHKVRRDCECGQYAEGKDTRADDAHCPTCGAEAGCTYPPKDDDPQGKFTQSCTAGCPMFDADHAITAEEAIRRGLPKAPAVQTGPGGDFVSHWPHGHGAKAP